MVRQLASGRAGTQVCFQALSWAQCYVKLSVDFDAFPLAGIGGTEGRRIPWVPWVESGLGREDTEQGGPLASEAEFWALHNFAKGFPHLLILGLVPSVLILINLFLHYTLGFPDSSVGKESACNVGDLGLIPRLGRSPGEGKGYPLQCSALENSMDCIGSDTTDYIHLSLVTPVPTCS